MAGGIVDVKSVQLVSETKPGDIVWADNGHRADVGYFVYSKTIHDEIRFYCKWMSNNDVAYIVLPNDVDYIKKVIHA